MDKDQAIQIAKDYIHQQNTRQSVSIDAYEILDIEPKEFKDFWCFKAYYQDMNPMRGDGLKLNSVYPYYLISKTTKVITLANLTDFDKLLNT